MKGVELNWVLTSRDVSANTTTLKMILIGTLWLNLGGGGSYWATNILILLVIVLPQRRRMIVTCIARNLYCRQHMDLPNPKTSTGLCTYPFQDNARA